MDCRESRELMSGAVDDELKREESEGFYEHIEICARCREEYELERLTKSYIRRKVTLVDVPYDLEGAILAQINSEGAITLNPGFFSRLLSNPIIQPVMAVGVVLVIAVVLFFANKPNLVTPLSSDASIEAIHGSEPDVLTTAMNNFQDVLNGTFATQITAVKAAEVASYLARNAGFNLPIPSVPNADWVGGSVTNSNGSKTTHLVYKIGEGYIYIYSFPAEAVASKHVSLPSNCSAAIKDKRWYWGMDQNGDTQAVWSYNNQVCVATANLQKKDLIGYLRTSYRMGQR